MPRPMPRKRMLQEVERLSELEAETREPIDPRMKKDRMQQEEPNYKMAPRKTKPKNEFRDNPEDRFGIQISEAKKGGYLKDIMGDKKGKVIYKGKAKDYKMIIPIEPPKPKTSKKMSGGMVKVKTKMGRTKPTKIY